VLFAQSAAIDRAPAVAGAVNFAKKKWLTGGWCGWYWARDAGANG
jgi:hypothetical protein